MSNIQKQYEGDREDILLRNFWMNGTNAVMDVRMTDVDAASYDNMTTEKCLAKHEQAKKKKYLQACLAQRMHFTPLVFSIDGVMGRETDAFVKILAKHLALKWDRPFSRVIDYLLTRLSIACVRATHRTMRSSRILVHDMSYMLPIFKDGMGMSLMY